MIGKNIIIIGGTQGIGKATAIKLANLGASVFFTGRNTQLGTQLENQLIDINSKSQIIKFIPFDVCDIHQVNEFTQNFKHKIHGLVLCAGGLNYGPRRETVDGIEFTFAQNVSSRFLLTKSLLPLFANQARVINCLGAGNGGKIDMNNIELKNNFGFLNAAMQYASINDLITMEFGKRYGNKAKFFHVFPGTVNTNSASNQGFPKLLTYIASFVLPLVATPPSKIADAFVKILNSDEYEKGEFEKGYGYLGPKAFYSPFSGDSIGTPKIVNEYSELGPVLWEYLEKRTKSENR